MNDLELRKWIEMTSTLFGALGFTCIVFGVLLLFASFKLWKAMPQ